MQHLDEGTIHTWLDGELGAAEAATLEAHVTTCADCAALVAEARGLAAASSRILGALDEVPSGIIPQAKPPVSERPLVVTPTPAHTIDLAAERAARATPRKTRRFFNPRFAAAAAILMMAAGTWTVLQRSGDDISLAAPAPTEIADMRAPAESVASLQAPAPVSTAPVDEASSAKLLRKERPAPVSTLGARPASPSAVGAVATLERAEADASKAAANEAPRQVMADAAAQPRRERVDTLREAPAAPPPSAKRFATSTDSLVAGEQRRLQSEVKAQAALSSPVVAGAAARGRATDVSFDKRDTSGSTCFTIDRTPLAVQLNIPARVELRSDDGPQANGITWKFVRVPGAVPDQGEWFWHRTDAALSLARFDGTPLVMRRQVEIVFAPGNVVNAATSPAQVRAMRAPCEAR